MIFKESKSKLAQILFGSLFVVLAGLFGAASAVSGNDDTALYFFDVGQGDSSLIQLPGGVQVLIDGGPSGKLLLENLAKVLPPQDRYIDLVLMTHPQLDHFGGLIEVVKKYEVGAFLGSGRKGDVVAYKDLSSQIEKNNIRFIALQEADAIYVGDAKLSVLSPSQTALLSGELNDTTLVVLFEAKELKALYTGDIDAHTEEELADRYDLNVDVLKVAHHGSRFSSSEKFLREVSPSVAVIEVGKNTYGHPTKAALDRISRFSRKILRTDKDGIVKVTADANTLSVFNIK